MKKFGFTIYLVYVISWFLHIPDRIPFLGTIRFDLILVYILAALIIFGGKSDRILTETDKVLKILIVYIFLTILLVTWPGSVIHFGLGNFAKGVVFYYFTVSFITSERKLKIFLFTFLACQSFRILEPTYLHITEGYWGSAAMMANWEFMDRLSGAPHDIINPNGLAYIIVTVIPFLYFLYSLSWKHKIIFLLMMPISLYALTLTASRSGIIALIVVYIGLIIKSKKKMLLFVFGITFAIFLFVRLGPELQERYLSILDPTTKHSDTARGRITAITHDIGFFLSRPFIGHGLGTSGETRWTVGSMTHISHILYGEVAIELGLIGLIIFLFFMKSIISNLIDNSNILRSQIIEQRFLIIINNALQVWMLMNIAFSFASYGLSGYVWYLLAGLSAVLRNLAIIGQATNETFPEGYSIEKKLVYSS